MGNFSTARPMTSALRSNFGLFCAFDEGLKADREAILAKAQQRWAVR